MCRLLVKMNLKASGNTSVSLGNVTGEATDNSVHRKVFPGPEIAQKMLSTSGTVAM